MFKRLTIDNYRIFQHIQLNDIGRVNLIVGMNNSGKSSLLEAIYLLTSDEPGTSLAFILNERGEFISRINDPRYDRRVVGGYQISHVFFGHSPEKVQHVNIRADNGKSNYGSPGFPGIKHSCYSIHGFLMRYSNRLPTLFMLISCKIPGNPGEPQLSGHYSARSSFSKRG
jgi:hypothetical protein